MNPLNSSSNAGPSDVWGNKRPANKRPAAPLLSQPDSKVKKAAKVRFDDAKNKTRTFDYRRPLETFPKPEVEGFEAQVEECVDVLLPPGAIKTLPPLGKNNVDVYVSVVVRLLTVVITELNYIHHLSPEQDSAFRSLIELIEQAAQDDFTLDKAVAELYEFLGEYGIQSVLRKAPKLFSEPELIPSPLERSLQLIFPAVLERPAQLSAEEWETIKRQLPPRELAIHYFTCLKKAVERSPVLKNQIDGDLLSQIRGAFYPLADDEIKQQSISGLSLLYTKFSQVLQALGEEPAKLWSKAFILYAKELEKSVVENPSITSIRGYKIALEKFQGRHPLPDNVVSFLESRLTFFTLLEKFFKEEDMGAHSEPLARLADFERYLTKSQLD